MSSIGLLTLLYPHRDAALLLMRVVVGAFLVWGVADNVFSAERMREFATFVAQSGFPVPGFMAPLSVWAQLAAGVAFVLGLFTRWAGVTVIGIYLATNGAGRCSLDRILDSRLA